MKCPGFSPELYDLYAIGTLEAEEAVELASHVVQQCETCLPELKRSLQFWTLFGVTFSGDAGAPIRRLSMVPALGAPPDRAPGRQRGLTWPQWGALAAALSIVSALSIWFALTRQPVSAPDTRIVVDNEALRQRVNDLSRERDRLRAEAGRAAAQPPSQPSIDIDSLRRLVDQRQSQLTAAQAVIAEIRDRNRQTEQALQETRAHEAQIESQLRSQSELLAASQRQQQDAESRLSNVNQDVTQAQAQIRRLTQQVQDLSRERTELLQRIEAQQTQSARGTQLISLLSAPGTKLVQIPGTEAAPQARGYALLTASGQVEFSESGLPPLTPNKDYQLWLIRSKSPAIVSAGVFHISDGQPAQVRFANVQLATNIKAFAVTDEPAGGSPGPTGHKVLVGAVR